MAAVSSVQASHAIATDVTAAVRKYMGRGPRHVAATIVESTVFIVLRDLYTVAERSLIADHQEGAVHTGREAVQMAMRERFQNIVQTHTGRQPIAFMSANHIDPDIAVEIIELDAAPDFQVY